MIRIICVGKIKENYLKEAISEYLKRLTKYTKIEIVELPDVSYDMKKTINEESLNILSHLKESDYNILLDINGMEYDSLEFAKNLDNIRNNNSNITFIIGGSYGVSLDVKNKVNMKISFSKLTFPHQLFRVMLLEQIYRSYKINNNESYHK